MIRLAEQLAIFYYVFVLPVQVAAGYTLGQQFGAAYIGMIAAAILGLVPAYFLLIFFRFGVFCGLAWVFLVRVILNPLAERGELPSSLILWVGGVYLVVPYIFLVSEKLDTPSERTLHKMPLEQLIASIRDVLENEDPAEEEMLLRRLQKERGRAAPLIIERYRKKRKWEEKTQLLRALGAIEHPVGLAFLREVLRTEKKFIVLYAAIEACAETGDAAFVTPLAQLMDRNDDHQLTMKSFEALGRIGTPKAVEIIRGLVATGTEAFVVESLTESAMKGLGDGHSEAGLPWVIEVLEGDPPEALWRAAVIALGAIGTPDALAALLNVLDRTRDEQLVGVAFWGIDPNNDRVIPWLAELLRSHDSNAVKGRAAEALLEMRSDDASRIVKDLLRLEQEKPAEQRNQNLIDDLEYYITESTID
jgi:HEAT repeat protein